MALTLNNLTFIIVTFKSEKIIFDCLNSLPPNVPAIIVENSQNYNMKKDIENKFSNIEVIISDNNGMGSSNNIGLRKCKTQYAYIINPDVKFLQNTIDTIIEVSKKINSFSILSPVIDQNDYPNYGYFNKKIISENDEFDEVDFVDGFSMIINKDKFKDQNYFDDNFFLYLENTDLCLRKKKEGEKIFIIKNAFIKHLGAGSANNDFKKEFEYLRNWHWMWSKFYFNKKHNGFFSGIKSIFFNFISAIFKYFIYLIIFNSDKKKIYLSRILGTINSVLGKKSWLRPKNIN